MLTQTIAAGGRSSGPPRISVVAVTPDSYQTIRKTVDALRSQTIHDAIELIIVVPSKEQLNLDEQEVARFHSCRVVEIGAINIMGAARAAGVHAAHAVFVAFVEDHAYPAPQWGEALLDAHAAGNVAIGTLMLNVNPATMTSWADLFLGFGPWVEPRAGGPAQRLPWHHTGYDRELLLSLGEQLPGMLETEGVFHAKLVAEGRPMFLLPISTGHVNISRYSSFLVGHYHGGRSFGGHRADEQGWSWLRRIIQAGGAPLVPLLRIGRVVKDVRDCGRTRQLLPRMLPAAMAGLTLHAFGEAVGYMFGAGGAARRKSDLEYHRDHHVCSSDRVDLQF